MDVCGEKIPTTSTLTNINSFEGNNATDNDDSPKMSDLTSTPISEGTYNIYILYIVV